MTHNQIEYWNYRENSRHNVETERETNRSNVARESETNRHNVVTETETHRSNVANEQLKGEENDIRREANVINREHYERMDAETSRHNAAQEYFSGRSLDTERERVTLGYYQSDQSLAGQMASVGAQYANVAEQQRAHMAQEAETNRSNLEKERETWRHNLAQEKVGWATSQAQQERASAASTQASVSARNQALEQQKWETAGYHNAYTQNKLMNEQAKTQQAQQERYKTQNRNDSINAGVNVANSLKGLLKDVASAALKGGK